MRSLLVLVLPVVAVFLAPLSSVAHEIHVLAHAQGPKITGQATYRGGGAVKEAAVTALDAEGRELARTKTDAEGRYTIEPRTTGKCRIVVDAGDGHGGDTTVAAGASKDEHLADHGHDGDVVALLRELHGEMNELHDELHEQEHRVFFRDILGGVGFILGLTGVAFYVVGMRRPKISGP